MNRKERIQNYLQSRGKDEKSVMMLLIQGYFLLTLVCLLLLLIPLFHGSDNSFINHIFFAVSIVSTTGLAPAGFADSYNFGGQIVSLIFIQLGGVGYMAISSFIILKQFSRLPNLSARLLKLEFNLPTRYPLQAFIYSVFAFTLIIEGIGALFLYYGFEQAGVDNPLWSAIFHSVSAFCTAGFSLYGDSMASFQENGLITYTILILSLLGSIGFIVLLDFWLKITGSRKQITLTSKIILFGTFSFIIVAAAALYFSDSILKESGWIGIKNALFQSISAHTTVGFFNYNISDISLAGIFIMIILMVIGASPAGTGGGIKTTSVSAILAVLISILKRRKYVTFFGKEIPSPNIHLAVASVCFYALIIILGTWVILCIDGDNFSFEKILFEVTSALSTVGLSAGITDQLSGLSKIIISLLMFIGRLGVLTFGLALIAESPLVRKKPTPEDIAI